VWGAGLWGHDVSKPKADFYMALLEHGNSSPSSLTDASSTDGIMPVFRASVPISPSTASSWALMKSLLLALTAVTPLVF
jgi:hypothetical protein